MIDLQTYNEHLQSIAETINGLAARVRQLEAAEVPLPSGSGGIKVATIRVITTYTILITDSAVYCNTDGGAYTVTLPAGVVGQMFYITNCGSSGNALTIACNGAETINDDATQTLTDYEAIDIIFETTENWRVF